METIEVCGMEIRVIRSARRKTILLRIGADGMPEMLAPGFCKADELKSVALKHSDRLAEYLANHREREKARESFELRPGSELRFLGGKVILTEREGNLVGYDDSEFFIPPGYNKEQTKAAVIQIYKLAAKNIITPKVIEYAVRMRLSPMSVKINSAKSHWASCSAHDTLNFSWYLAMAEPGAVDYVVVHELCHMKEFNHSSRFWQSVAEYCPDYEAKKRYLKELWDGISRENWL